MANEIHGTKSFDAVTAVEIDFGVEEGVGHDIVVSCYEIWGRNDFHIAHDEVATAQSHLQPANLVVSRAIPCRRLSILGGGGASGVVYWLAVPLMGIEAMSDLEAQTHRGGIDC